MTIGIGILASNGIVLAADSEISMPPDLKGTDTKNIRGHCSDRKRAYCGTCCSRSRDGRIFSIRKVGRLETHCRASRDRNEPLLSAYMSAFHDKHVVPYLPLPENERPAVQLLIANWSNGRGNLFATELGAARTVIGYDAIGIGRGIAIDILNSYAKDDLMPVESAALLAIYVIRRVTQVVAYCGHETQVVLLKNGGAFGLSKETR